MALSEGRKSRLKYSLGGKTGVIRLRPNLIILVTKWSRTIKDWPIRVATV